MVSHGFWHRDVAVAAYYRWQASDSQHGRDFENWLGGIHWLNERWRSRFPRLSELYAGLPEHAYGGFFDSLPSRATSNDFFGLRVPYFESIESDLGRLSDRAWDHLRQQILRNYRDSTNRAISFLKEATGYGRLKDTLNERRVAFDDIVAPSSGTTQEWEATLAGAIVAAVEVKTVFRSDDETNYVNENTQRLESNDPLRMRRGTAGMSEGLWRKLDQHVAKAKDQLAAVHGDDVVRIAWLFVNLDHEAFNDDNRQALAGYAQASSDEHVEVRCEACYTL